MKTLPDGRLVFLNNNNLTIVNPEDNSTIQKSLNNYYDYNDGFFAASNTLLYSRNSEKLYKIDITDIDNIVETSLISLGNNQSFEGHLLLMEKCLFIKFMTIIQILG